MSERDWFALRVVSQKWLPAKKMLEGRGFEVWLPTAKKYRLTNGYANRKATLHIPLMAGYVFVGFPPGERPWADVFGCCHLVKAVVGVNGCPARFNPHHIADMQARCAAGEFDAPDVQAFQPSRREYAVGDVVEVLDGPLEGRIGRVQDITEGRVKLLLTLFGAKRVVTASARDVGAVA